MTIRIEWLHVNGREKQDHNVRFEVEASEVLHVLYAGDEKHQYIESA